VQEKRNVTEDAPRATRQQVESRETVALPHVHDPPLVNVPLPVVLARSNEGHPLPMTAVMISVGGVDQRRDEEQVERQQQHQQHHHHYHPRRSLIHHLTAKGDVIIIKIYSWHEKS